MTVKTVTERQTARTQETLTTNKMWTRVDREIDHHLIQYRTKTTAPFLSAMHTLVKSHLVGLLPVMHVDGVLNPIDELGDAGKDAGCSLVRTRSAPADHALE